MDDTHTLTANTISRIEQVAAIACELYLAPHFGFETAKLQRIVRLLKDIDPDQSSAIESRNGLPLICQIFLETMRKMNADESSFMYDIHARELAFSAELILKARTVIDIGKGLRDAKRIPPRLLVSSNFLLTDLVYYAWASEKCKCDVILGYLISASHQKGKVGGLLINQFGPELTTSLFRQSHDLGLYAYGKKSQASAPEIAYRGGFFDPYDGVEKLASGMCWTDDPQQAAWFANRRIGQTGIPVVIATELRNSETLARFEYEKEIVLAHDDYRGYEVIAQGEDDCIALEAEFKTETEFKEISQAA